MFLDVDDGGCDRDSVDFGDEGGIHVDHLQRFFGGVARHLNVHRRLAKSNGLPGRRVQHLSLVQREQEKRMPEATRSDNQPDNTQQERMLFTLHRGLSQRTQHPGLQINP